MNSTLIATFIAVARTKNISSAACELNQVQSTISKRLRQLEDYVGHRLFDRQKGAKHVELTPEGEEFMGVAERWLYMNDELMRLQQTNRPTDLKIACVDSLNSSFMKEVYRSVAATEKSLRLSIRTYFFQEMYAAVAERKADIGFSFHEAAHISLRVMPLYTEPMVGLRRAERASWLAEPVLLASLRQECEVYAPWGNTHDIWRKTYFVPSLPPYITVYPVSQILEQMDAPELWSIVPRSFAMHAVDKAPFSIFSILPEPPPRSCFYITHSKPKDMTTAAIQCFERRLMPTLDRLFGPKRNGNSKAMIELRTRLMA